METVTLWTGVVAPAPTVHVMTVALRNLHERDPQAFAELAAYARGGPLGAQATDTLSSLRIISEHGGLSQAARDTVLACTSDAGTNFIQPVIPVAQQLAPLPDRTPEQDRTLVSQCKKIAAVYDDVFPWTRAAVTGHRASGVNPCYNQIRSGICLEYYYEYPSKLWTPWGSWTFASVSHGSAASTPEQECAPFMARLTTSLLQPQQKYAWGVSGPVYTVLAVDGDPVEPASTQPTVKRSYDDANESWEQAGGPHMTHVLGADAIVHWGDGTSALLKDAQEQAAANQPPPPPLM